MRDVCANRTPRCDRARQRGKSDTLDSERIAYRTQIRALDHEEQQVVASDTLDSERIAREVLAHSLLPKAFKRAGADSGPDEQHELLALWHNRRLSILTSRQHLVNEAEHLLCSPPPTARRSPPTPSLHNRARRGAVKDGPTGAERQRAAQRHP